MSCFYHLKQGKWKRFTSWQTCIVLCKQGTDDPGLQQLPFEVLKTVVCVETQWNGPVDLLAKGLEIVFSQLFYSSHSDMGIIHKLGLMNDSTKELDKDFSKDWRKGRLWRWNHWYLILPLSCRVTNPPHNFTLVQGPIISTLETCSRLLTPSFPNPTLTHSFLYPFSAFCTLQTECCF